MNNKPQSLRWFLMFLLSVIATGVFGQNTDPAQTVCISSQNYSVIPGDPGNTFHWAVTPGTSGTDWTINSPTVVNTDIVWLKSGIYTVTFTETNVVTNCATIVSVLVTVLDLPAATIAYGGSPYCASGTANVTQGGQTGGSYTSTAGLSLNTSSGAIDLTNSTPGTYTVTYTFTNGTCVNTTTTSVTINAHPTATIGYSGAPFCALGTASVTQTGTTGGTYTSTAGLSINASTGAIDLTASTPGTYLITYSFTAGACSNTTTTSVIINALPATSPIRHN